MWSDAWVGLEYAELGRGPAYDCLGLFLALHRARFGRDLPDSMCPMNPEAVEAARAAQKGMWRLVSGAAQEGDALLFRVRGQLLHLGFCLGARAMLHIEGPAGSVIEDWTAARWRARREGVYRFAG
jgi:cell wall-associated NlpC family hydrolase